MELLGKCYTWWGVEVSLFPLTCTESFLFGRVIGLTVSYIMYMPTSSTCRDSLPGWEVDQVDGCDTQIHASNVDVLSNIIMVMYPLFYPNCSVAFCKFTQNCKGISYWVTA